jgi:spore coat polysaccharide biosynthesis protein SpsF (cytidylyltransferase family)
MIGILINVRLSSTRLAKKHLIEASGKPLLEWLILRVQNRFAKEIENHLVKIIIVSGDEPCNEPLSSLATKWGIGVFFGAKKNIPLRQFQCAEKFGFSGIVNVDGDDILCSTEAMFEVYRLLQLNVAPIITTQGLPFGLNSMGYSFELLKKASGIFKEIIELDTGWGSVFQGSNKLIFLFGKCSDFDADIRMTLDYQEDAQFFIALISLLGNEVVSISDEKMIQIVKDKGLYKLNEDLKEVYWKNYNATKNE